MHAFPHSLAFAHLTLLLKTCFPRLLMLEIASTKLHPHFIVLCLHLRWAYYKKVPLRVYRISAGANFRVAACMFYGGYRTSVCEFLHLPADPH